MRGYYGWQNDWFDPEPWEDEEFDYSEEPTDVNELGEEEDDDEDAIPFDYPLPGDRGYEITNLTTGDRAKEATGQ